MKRIYCIEKWMPFYEPVRVGWKLDEWWKIGKEPYIEEYDDENKFKNELIRLIEQGDIVSNVFIKTENDNYPSLKIVL